MKIFRVLISLAFILPIVNACGSEEEGNNGLVVSAESGGNELLGIWTDGKCLASDTVFVSNNLMFDQDGTIENFILVHADNQCTQTLARFSRNGTYQALMGDIDVNLTDDTAIALTMAEANFYNENNFCARDNWQVDVSFDITACDTVPQNVVLPATGYTRYRVDGDNLHFDLNFVGGSTQSRTDAPSIANYFRR